MNRFLAFFLLSFLTAPVWGQNGGGNGEKGQSRLWLDTHSKLIISVSTNVNAFPCTYESVQRSDIIEFEYLTKDHQSVEIENASLAFPLNQFDCGQKVKNREFKDLLNEEEHGSIFINLKGLQINEDDSKGVLGHFYANVNVAGVNRDEQIHIEDLVSDHEMSVYTGYVTINIRAYDLEPPVKFLGMVKVSEEVRIDFEFRFVDANGH